LRLLFALVVVAIVVERLHALVAADTVIVEADHIVPVGVIPPDTVATPFVCVDYIVKGGDTNGR